MLEESSTGLLPFGVAGVRIVVIKTDERHCLVCERARVVGSSIGVSSDHLQAVGEGVDLLVLASRSLKVAARDEGFESARRRWRVRRTERILTRSWCKKEWPGTSS